MITKTKQFHLSVSHYKIMDTINELNKRSMFPNVRGVEQVLSGSTDDETIKYKDLRTYGTLISLQGRKMCSYITNMVRHGYITYIYDEKTDDMYLTLTPRGVVSLDSYMSKHHIKLTKKVRISRPNIVYIKK